MQVPLLSFGGSPGVGTDSGAITSLWGKRCIHTPSAQWATHGIAEWGHLLGDRVMLTELAMQQGEPGGLEEANTIKQPYSFSPWISLPWKKET